jgi:hypothetical protein
MSLRATLADPGLRGTVLVGALVGALGLWVWWDRTTPRVSEARVLLWTDSGPLGMGTPSDDPQRYRITTRDGHPIEVVRIDAAGARSDQPGAWQRLVRDADGVLSEIHHIHQDQLMAKGDVSTDQSVMTVRWTDGSGNARGNPTSGALVEAHRFDTRGRLSEVRYLGNSGTEAVGNAHHVFGVRIARDTRGRPIERVYLGPRGVPAPNMHGVLTRTLTWHGEGWGRQHERFLDRDGAPIPGPLGCATRSWSPEGLATACLDPDGQPISPHPP